MRLTLLPLILLAACALPRREAPAPVEPAVSVTEAPGAEVLRPRARAPAQAPVPTAEPAAAGLLGETLAGLGAPGEAGLWLSTGLVSAARPGRVTTAAGQSVALDLRPSGAAPTAGSHLSLAAMRALGAPLGQLVALRVFAD